MNNKTISKKFIIILSIILSLALITSIILISCVGYDDNGESSSSSSEDVNPNGDFIRTPVEHLQDGLHLINITPSDNDFIKNGKSEYTVIVPDNADEVGREASTYILSNVLKATQAELKVAVATSVTWNENAKFIVLGCKDLFEKAGLTMPNYDLGDTGYYIVSKGNSVFIMGEASYGVRNGALEFLAQTVGYNRYSKDMVVYKNASSSIKMPNFEIIERADFEYMIAGCTPSAETEEMRFLTVSEVLIGINEWYYHNSFGVVPPEKYNNVKDPANYHPAWFADDGLQLCYNAHGIENEYEAMMNLTVDTLYEAALKDPVNSVIPFTLQDNFSFCACDACLADKAKYGTDAAAIIHYCNDAAKRLNKLMEAHDREITIIFFAYRASTNPPVVKNADGSYSPIDESVICDKNVGAFIAPITSNFNYSYYEKENADAAAVIEGWGAICDQLYIWLYETNFSHYLYPYNSYESMTETFRFCKQNNALYMFSQGQIYAGNTTAFGSFKTYLDSKVLWNVNENYLDLVDDFFANYFREAAAPLRIYFEELQMHMRRMEKEYPQILTGDIYDNVNKAQLWPKKTLEHWLDLINQGFDAIEIYKETDPQLYEVLYDHLLLETIFPRFALLELYTGRFSEQVLYEERKSFIADCARVKVTQSMEGLPIEQYFLVNWGMTA